MTSGEEVALTPEEQGVWDLIREKRDAALATGHPKLSAVEATQLTTAVAQILAKEGLQDEVALQKAPYSVLLAQPNPLRKGVAVALKTLFPEPPDEQWHKRARLSEEPPTLTTGSQVLAWWATRFQDDYGRHTWQHPRLQGYGRNFEVFWGRTQAAFRRLAALTRTAICRKEPDKDFSYKYASNVMVAFFYLVELAEGAELLRRPCTKQELYTSVVHGAHTRVDAAFCLVPPGRVVDGDNLYTYLASCHELKIGPGLTANSIRNQALEQARRVLAQAQAVQALAESAADSACQVLPPQAAAAGCMTQHMDPAPAEGRTAPLISSTPPAAAGSTDQLVCPNPATAARMAAQLISSAPAPAAGASAPAPAAGAAAQLTSDAAAGIARLLSDDPATAASIAAKLTDPATAQGIAAQVSNPSSARAASLAGRLSQDLTSALHISARLMDPGVLAVIADKLATAAAPEGASSSTQHLDLSKATIPADKVTDGEAQLFDRSKRAYEAKVKNGLWQEDRPYYFPAAMSTGAHMRSIVIIHGPVPYALCTGWLQLHGPTQDQDDLFDLAAEGDVISELAFHAYIIYWQQREPAMRAAAGSQHLPCMRDAELMLQCSAASGQAGGACVPVRITGECGCVWTGVALPHGSSQVQVLVKVGHAATDQGRALREGLSWTAYHQVEREVAARSDLHTPVRNLGPLVAAGVIVDVATSEGLDPAGMRGRAALLLLRTGEPLVPPQGGHALHALPLEECMVMCACLSAAVLDLHRQGVAHGDIRPANVGVIRGAPPLQRYYLFDLGTAWSAAVQRLALALLEQANQEPKLLRMEYSPVTDLLYSSLPPPFGPPISICCDLESVVFTVITASGHALPWAEAAAVGDSERVLQQRFAARADPSSLPGVAAWPPAAQQLVQAVMRSEDDAAIECAERFLQYMAAHLEGRDISART